MTPSRQVQRAADRKNDYWQIGRWSRGTPVGDRQCLRENSTNRGHVSARVIAAKAPRKRTAPRKPSRHPEGLRHAWQRKAKFFRELRELMGQS